MHISFWFRDNEADMLTFRRHVVFFREGKGTVNVLFQPPLNLFLPVFLSASQPGWLCYDMALCLNCSSIC